jgi:hypothetical protein
MLLSAQILVLGWILLTDLFDARNEALTMKSLFIAGYILFQPGSALFTIITGEDDVVAPDDIGSAGLIFAVMSWVFMSLFLWFYGTAKPMGRLAARPGWFHYISDWGLLATALACLVGGIVMRDVLGPVPVIGALTIMLSAGFFAAACGASAWGWARDPGNPVKAIGGAAVIVATAVALLQNSFSRRGLIAAVFCVVWAAYFARWRVGSRTALVGRALVVGVIGLVFVLFQTASRGEKGVGGTAGEYLESFTRVDIGDLGEVALSMTSGQFAGVNSMWLIETFPNQHAYWPLHSLRYFVTQPIPRILWEGKPWSLGNEMVHLVGVTGVKRDEFSLGCGIIGHIAVDIPFIALPLYAFMIAWALRYLDDRCALWAGDPFVIIPISAATSQILGLARGELGLFAFNALAWSVGGWLAVRLVGVAFWRKEVYEPIPFNTEHNEPLSGP